MIVRIGIVLLLSTLMWKFILYLNNTFLSDEYNPTVRLWIALATAVLCFVLVDTARRIDKTSWKQLGMESLNKNIAAFLIGIFLWAVPAAIGLAICLLVGWSEITVTAEPSQLLVSLVILAITVFTIEAFPEELIFRSYLYSYLNAWLSHWLTLIAQSLLFTFFAYLVGAMYSLEQILFIPGFGFMLGYFRAKSGNVWTSIGFHAAIMTATQILSPIHNHFEVSGIFAVRFFAFNLLPYTLGAIALEYIYPNHDWQEKVPLGNR